MWVLADAVSPKWAFVKNKPLVDKLVVVLVDGLNEDLFRTYHRRLPCLKHHCSDPARELPSIPLAIPSSVFSKTSVLEGLLNCPLKKLTGVRKNKNNKQQQSGQASHKGDELPSKLFYVLSR